MRVVWTRGSAYPAKKARHSGSALLLALFACLVATLCVHVVTATVLIGERAIAEETDGRDRLQGIDMCLAAMREQATASWVSTDWTGLSYGQVEVAGRVVAVEGAERWLLRAEARQDPAGPFGVTGALVERGRDGLDLPDAAVVASVVNVRGPREGPWLVTAADEADEEVAAGVVSGTSPDSIATAYVGRVEGEIQIGPDCALERLDDAWVLDEGWIAFLESESQCEERVCVIEGEPGQVVRPPEEVGSGCSELPILVVALGCDLDASGLGDVWGVFVAGGGSILLEGTVLRGAVFANQSVEVGTSGRIVFEQDVWSWATDRSLSRMRLVPGTRSEGTR